MFLIYLFFSFFPFTFYWNFFFFLTQSVTQGGVHNNISLVILYDVEWKRFWDHGIKPLQCVERNKPSKHFRLKVYISGENDSYCQHECGGGVLCVWWKYIRRFFFWKLKNVIQMILLPAMCYLPFLHSTSIICSMWWK